MRVDRKLKDDPSNAYTMQFLEELGKPFQLACFIHLDHKTRWPENDQKKNAPF